MISPSPLLRCGLIAVVIGVGLWSLATLRFQTELLPLFPQDLASVRTLKRAQTSISSEREILAVPQPNPGWPVLQKFAEELGDHPGIKVHVGFGSNRSPAQWLATAIAGLPADRFAAVQHAFIPETMRSRLADTLQQMTGVVDEMEIGRLHFDPLRLQEIAFPKSESSPANLANVAPVLTFESTKPLRTFEDSQQFVSGVRFILNQHANLTPGTQFLLTGQPAITADVSRHMKRDLIVMLSFTVLLTSLAFWAFYRSLMPLLWIVTVQLLALLCALAVARVVFAEINILSIGFSSILLGVGMDYCILVYHFFAQPGERKMEAWRELRRAIWLSACTTAAAFGVLYFSSFPGLRQLAVLVGSGLLATAFFATTLLADRLAHKRPHAPEVLTKVSDTWAQFLFRYRAFVVGAAVALVLGIVAFSPRWMTYSFYDSSLNQLEPTQLESTRAGKLLAAQAPRTPSTSSDTEINRERWRPVALTDLERAFQSAGLDATWTDSTRQLIDALNHWHAGTLDLTGPNQANAAWLQLRNDLNITAVSDFKRLSLAMLAVVILLCVLTHRSTRLVLLNFAALLMALLLLGAMLYVTRHSMTIVSLLCIPLMIGLVIDYSLHILLALEHADGRLADMTRHIGVPVLLTGLASIIGFTAPLLSSQPALQNFGTVMDLATVAAVVSGLVLLPALYTVTRSTDSHHYSKWLYQAPLFTLGELAAKILPLQLTRALAGGAGSLYALTHPEKVAVVHRNLALLSDRADCRTARRVYKEFGRTLTDYFYIGTRSRTDAMKLITKVTGANHLHDVHARGKGGIIVTAHFGLFELGGLFTAEQGIPVSVLTWREPSRALTDWRAQFRKRWGAETIEIGTDPFSFLPVTERLQRGQFVAALIDRPHPAESVDVRLPHGTTGFSPGILLLAAHLGTPVLPATMVRQADGSYHAHIFPPLLIQPQGSRTNTLTVYSQQIADILLPELCEHPEQWYQFTPLSRSS